MDIRCDLERELNRYAEAKLKELNYKFDSNHNLSIFQQYMNIARREVSNRQRQVFISRTLTVPPQHQDGFNSLVESLRLGKNVNINLSSNLKNAGYSDGFLNDFGLHHFHLGVKIITSGKSKGFIERSGPILIAHIKDDAVYLIGIYDHGKNSDPHLWTDKKVIEIIHNEWPYIIEPFKITMFASISQEPTPEERKKLREASVNSFVKMPDGTCYAPIGGGITMANTSMDVTYKYLGFYRYSKKMLSHLCTSIEESNTEHMSFPIRLELRSLLGGFIYEEKSNFTTYFIYETETIKVRFVAFTKGILPEFYPRNVFTISQIAAGILTYRHKHR